ncbi:MAG: hypothetical protein IPJ65_24030 [Archangiaceae bacterium]|nr:hypothetical protein [Archangiaceae bacterium]
MSARRHPKRLGLIARGQGMLEYTMITHALLIGGAAFCWPFLVYLMRALSIYFKSIYFVISSPVP